MDDNQSLTSSGSTLETGSDVVHSSDRILLDCLQSQSCFLVMIHVFASSLKYPLQARVHDFFFQGGGVGEEDSAGTLQVL